MENNMEHNRNNAADASNANVLEWRWKRGTDYDTAVASDAAQPGALTIKFEDHMFSGGGSTSHGAIADVYVGPVNIDTSEFAYKVGSDIDNVMATASDMIAAFLKREPELDVMFHINNGLLQKMEQVLNKIGLKTTVDNTYYDGDDRGEQPIVFVWNPAK
jgi:hypothetical protein